MSDEEHLHVMSCDFFNTTQFPAHAASSNFRDHGMHAQCVAAEWHCQCGGLQSKWLCPGGAGVSVASGTDKLLLGAEWQGTALVDELKPWTGLSCNYNCAMKMVAKQASCHKKMVAMQAGT